MWHFSMQGLPAINVTIKSRRLLPYVFTFVRLSTDSYFLWHCLFPPKAGPGSSPVHCSVLSGLSFPMYIGTIAWLVAKISKKRIANIQIMPVPIFFGVVGCSTTMIVPCVAPFRVLFAAQYLRRLTLQAYIHMIKFTLKMN
jgi:hypothetical protein